MANILYISLTGMTEPLGRSQVLEYLIDLSKNNDISLISFERVKDLDNKNEIEKIIKSNNIKWDYFIYSNRFGIFSSLAQLTKAIIIGIRIIPRKKIEIIHARSFIPAVIGLILKKIFGVKLLFDIRGFAIDEKVDSGRLKKDSFLYKILKRIENYLYRKSDFIVTLTYASKNIISKNFNINENLIEVIPTCANKNIFKVLDEKEKILFKKSLGYTESDKIIIHTGTVSNRYDFDAEVKFFKKLYEVDKSWHFLIINKGEHKYIKEKLLMYGLPQESFKIKSSNFDDMNKYLSISNMSIFFIPPTYAKKAMSPTKFAENVACYLPSITNTGVGDMEYYLTKYNVGFLVDLNKLTNDLENEVNKIYQQIIDFKIDKKEFDLLFNTHFDKKIAIDKYNKIYERINK